MFPPATGPGRRCAGCFAAGSAMAPGNVIPPGCRPRPTPRGWITWEVSVDSTIAGAHQHAAGARNGGTANAKNRRGRHRAGRPRAGTPSRRADHQGGTWRSREASGRCRSWSPPASVATARSLGRCWASGCRALPGRPCTRPDRVLADKAYSARANRALLRCRASAPPSREGRPGRPLASQGPPGRAATSRTRWLTSCGASRWSVGSTGSSGTGGGHRYDKRLRCATGPP